MAVFTLPEHNGHEQVVFCAAPKVGLRAIIAIHNTNLGPALGGCRMWPYRSEDEALVDALRLSRAMTYKSALAGLSFGGGKAVVMGDPRTDKSEALLRALGRFVDSLGGRYHIAEDVGTTVADMDIIRQETRFAHGISDGTGNPSPSTAYGVYVGIKAAVKHRFGTADVAGFTIAVQGLGNVGFLLCRYLAEAGARLVVADIAPAAVARAVAAFGATAVDPAMIHRVSADVFAPCALGSAISDETVPALTAAIVAGSANNQLATPHHGAWLKARGILYAPDYAINAGGVIDVACEGPGYSMKTMLARVEGIYGTLIEIFETAEREDLPTNVIADRMAESRFVPRRGRFAPTAAAA